ncbi:MULTISPECIES: helix-turn-helix domain-containing protein [Candidatus Regiella]|uniref:HTH cro/C1-type domain-containing protein n=1 Tax=Candidatus Regiella insecticola TaxID=138073 RepID=A0A6L2ZM70_9ENTR|nr:helix-turn-helix transcriptional regulator [Candidatus Regiella insecticola]GFN45947.1 uncharacterized protein RINTU1_13370 [Candidatus Regiella insecticola]
MKGIPHAKVRAKLLSDPLSLLAYEEAHREAELALMLQNIREKAGITRTEIALRMGVTPPVVTRIEQNVIKASIHTLERYASACGSKLDIRAIDL